MKKEKVQSKLANRLVGIAGFMILLETFVSMFLIEFFNIKWAWIPLLVTTAFLSLLYLQRCIAGKEDYYDN